MLAPANVVRPTIAVTGASHEMGWVGVGVAVRVAWRPSAASSELAGGGGEAQVRPRAKQEEIAKTCYPLARLLRTGDTVPSQHCAEPQSIV